MKRTAKFSALFLVWAIGLAAPVSADLEVESLIQRFYDAAAERDWNAVGELLSEDFEIFSDGAYRADKVTYVTLMKEDDIAIEELSINDMQTHVSSDREMAWSKYRTRLRATSNGARHDVETVETLFFERGTAGWQITHAHVSVKEQPPAQLKPADEVKSPIQGGK